MSSDFSILAIPIIAVAAVAATGAIAVFDVVWRHPKKVRSKAVPADRVLSPRRSIKDILDETYKLLGRPPEAVLESTSFGEPRDVFQSNALDLWTPPSRSFCAA